MAVMVVSLAWMLAISQRRTHDCPSLLVFITSSRAVSCNIVVVRLSYPRARPAEGATIHTEGDCGCRGLPRVALQLSLFDGAAAHPI